MRPVVSICCMTYNHENFIKDCIEGFINQKTDFNYELLIHDDASNDKTADIIREYESKYPHIIKGFYQTENQFLKQNILVNILFPRAKGKYISLCEGDDYWISQNKLQKQVDFLEKFDDCNYVFTRKKNLKQGGNIVNENYDLPNHFDLHLLLKKKIMPSTPTIIFRNDCLTNQIKDLLTFAFNGDWVLLFLLTHNSNIGFIDEETAVYREGVGIISKTNVIVKMKNGIETNKKLNEITNYKFNKYLRDRRFNYSEISYYYAREKKFLYSLGWFFKTEFHLITFHGIKSIMGDWNKRYIKNSFNIIFNRSAK